MPMDKLDGIVIGEVTNQRLQPEQHVGLRGDYLRTAREREDRNRDQLRQMRQDHKESEAGIARLLELVGKGLMDAEAGSMRERLVNLRFRRDELADQISDLTRRLAMAEPEITPEKIERSEEHTSELQSLMRISYAVFCLKKKNTTNTKDT